MAKTISQLLAVTNMLGAIQLVKPGVPNQLPPGFFSSVKGTIGDSGKYTRTTGNRKTARQVQYGSPSNPRQLGGTNAPAADSWKASGLLYIAGIWILAPLIL